MGVDGYQVYVRHDDPGAVRDAIGAYVAEHGASAIINPDEDLPSPNMAKRSRRTFALSPPVDGTIAVWEDGSWSERRMAQDLSRRLGTEAYWLMASEITDSWAHARYADGRELEREHPESDDVVRDVRRYAEEHGLPFALEYLEDPNEDAEYEEFRKELEASGYFDAPADGDEDEEPEVEIIELDDDEAEELLEEDESGPEPQLPAVRDRLLEFAIDV
jgi:hypothetical protein